MKKARIAICAGVAALALSLGGCSNLLGDVSTESAVLSSRSVTVNDSLSKVFNFYIMDD